MKLKNDRRQIQKKRTSNLIVNQSLDLDTSISNIGIETAQYKEYVFELKNLIVRPENMELFKEKLKLTYNFRQEMIKSNNNLDLLENFPYFFSSPELVRRI